MASKKSFDFGGDFAWRPSPELLNQSHLKQFCDLFGADSFEALHRKSIGDIGGFTDAVLKYLDVRFVQPYSRVVDLGDGIQWPRWCVGGKMNITQSCLDKYLGTPTQDSPALVWEGEEGRTVTLTFTELSAEVNRGANALRSLGVSEGDAVGLFLPMTPEIVAAFLAIARIGGIIIPLFSGFGAAAVASRLADAEAKVLFTSDGAFRRGNVVSMKSVADEALRSCPSVEHVVVLKRAENRVEMRPGRDLWWDDLVPGQNDQAEAAIVDAETPLMIIYTSGTTGRPKGAVHTHCGFPVKGAQDMAFGMDVHPGDVMYWMSDMGWMMGPWLVFGTTLLRATMLLYDGAPDYPDIDRLWELVERHRVTQLGIAPTLVRVLMKFGEEPLVKHDLSSLKAIGSTGEPWNPAPWKWTFEQVGKSRIPIINYSGGTEISGGIVMGNPMQPLKPCAFSGPCPGIDADVYDEAGQSIRGQVGELVIRQPWIGMTRGFWKDPDRYYETYWSRWPDTWVHGDFAAIDGDGLWYILGRSDDTIKIAGKRVGPAEVESILVNHPAVVEAAAIAVPDEIKGNALVCFCVLHEDSPPPDQLKEELLAKVAEDLGKPLRPYALFFVSDLPKTRNAKLMRRLVRSAFLGEDLGDTSSLENPESLHEIQAACS